MYTLYIANKNYSSWSLRPWVLLKTLNIPFTEKLIPFAAPEVWSQHKDVMPTGKVPTLQDDATMIWDSLAITEFIAEEHSRVWPENKTARAWARSAASEMHSGFQSLRNICGMNCGIRVQLKEITPALQKDLGRLDDLWSQGLQNFGGPFLAGKNFTAVDAFYAPVAFRIQTYNLPMSEASMKYVQTLLELTSMKQWYEEAISELWRDEPHEKDISKVGIITKDLRHR